MKGKPIKTLCAVVATFFLGLSVGCKGEVDVPKTEIPKTEIPKTEIPKEKNNKEIVLETIEGQPISVYANGPHLRTLIKDEKGKYIFCRNVHIQYHSMACNGAALIKSEMNDGDNEPIYLTGHYNGPFFEIKVLKTNGYFLNFAENTLGKIDDKK